MLSAFSSPLFSPSPAPYAWLSFRSSATLARMYFKRSARFCS